MTQEEISEFPFHIVAMDLFEYAGRDYVTLFDAYSNYLTAVRIRNKTSSCDNSPFGSSEFTRFSQQYNIEFRLSNPG